MISRRHLLAGAGLAACRQAKHTGFAGHAFVANYAGQAIAAVDLTAFAVLRHIPLPASPTQLVALNSRPVVLALTPQTGELHEINAAQLKAARRFRLGIPVTGIRCSPGEDLWGLSPARQILRVDLERGQPDFRIHLPAPPVDLVFAPDGKQAAASLGDSGQIALLQTGQSKPERIVRTGGDIGAMLFRKDGRYLLAADRAQRQLVIYDLAQGRLVVRLPLAVRPDHLCVSDDGGQLFVTGEGADALVIVYPYETQVGAFTLAGRAPGAMAASPDILFITNPQSGDVTIFNIRTQRIMAVTPVGREPSYIAITPNNEFALVLNRQSGDLAVLYIAPLSTGRSRFTAPLTRIPVGSQPVSAVVRAV